MRRRRASRGRRTNSWLRALLFTLGVAVAVFVVAGVLAVRHALHIEKQLKGLPAAIERGEKAAESGNIAGAEAELAQAQRVLTSANTALYNSPEFEIVGVLPVASQNLAALRGATTLALQMVGGGEDILRAAAPLEGPTGHLDVSLRRGQIPLAATQAVETAIENVLSGLPVVTNPPHRSFLIGQVRTAQNRIYSEEIRRRNQLQSVAAALRIALDVAGARGPRRYLIAVSNSAEMRGSGGMILSYGILTSQNGRVTLKHFGDIDELKLSSPETAVSFPADFTKTYEGLTPTEAWRNANMMSDFTVDGPVLAAMFKHATGLNADGVIQVDSAGLGALLSGVGPVQTADLGTVSAANVVAVTLSEAYALYPNRTARQDYTGEVAQAAFGRLTNGDFSSLRPLGTALVGAGKQRHLMMWAADPQDESALTGLGFSGGLPPSSYGFTQLTVQNFGADKLDYYLSSQLAFTGSPPSAAGSHMTATITLHNSAPPGQTTPTEVFGPFLPTNPHGVAGEYLGLVTLYLPAGSYAQASHTDRTITTGVVSGSQNGVATVSYTVAIPAGDSSVVTINLYVAPSVAPTGRFLFVPSPRVIPTTFSQKFL